MRASQFFLPRLKGSPVRRRSHQSQADDAGRVDQTPRRRHLHMDALGLRALRKVENIVRKR